MCDHGDQGSSWRVLEGWRRNGGLVKQRLGVLGVVEKMAAWIMCSLEKKKAAFCVAKYNTPRARRKVSVRWFVFAVDCR